MYLYQGYISRSSKTWIHNTPADGSGHKMTCDENRFFPLLQVSNSNYANLDVKFDSSVTTEKRHLYQLTLTAPSGS